MKFVQQTCAHGILKVFNYSLFISRSSRDVNNTNSNRKICVLHFLELVVASHFCGGQLHLWGHLGGGSVQRSPGSGFLSTQGCFVSEGLVFIQQYDLLSPPLPATQYVERIRWEKKFWHYGCKGRAVLCILACALPGNAEGLRKRTLLIKLSIKHELWVITKVCQ